MKVPVNADELAEFSAVLSYLDARGLQVEGRVYVPGAGYMTIDYDGVNDVNTVVDLEVEE